ncbi:GNAT family N-acetyltransferase [Pseudothauera rhizosphaerae]|nr:GNAT family N-acetyltransferase [Pseudothauera rhizosphaerae]
MEHTDIRPLTVAEFEQQPNLGELFAQYAEESAIPELGEHIVQFDTYRAMEAAGALIVRGAFRGGEMVGFIVLIVSVLPHFGVRTATTESFFVVPAERRGALGARLLYAAEAAAREASAVGLFVCAPAGGRLERVMAARSDYRQTNAVFFRGLE